MHSEAPVEHFVTLFDSNFLVTALCLHESLQTHVPHFHLWILCMDDQVAQRIEECNLVQVTTIALSEIETEALLQAKPTRSHGEYCWTLTPFTPDFVLSRRPDVARVTYIDADLFFFKSPECLFRDFEQSQAHALITPHAYAKEYDQSAIAGIYCVQFMTFRNTPEARKILNWWQERCVEWCYAKPSNGRFGDQKYLDDWPTRFGQDVYVVDQSHLTLAPWNTTRFPDIGLDNPPVFFHFHGVRQIKVDRVRLCWGYRLSAHSLKLYERYFQSFKKYLKLNNAKYGSPRFSTNLSLKSVLQFLLYTFTGKAMYGNPEAD